MCADFYTRLLHIAALGLHVQHSCALCFFTYKSTHSRMCAYVLLACSSSPCLGLALALSSLHSSPARRPCSSAPASCALRSSATACRPVPPV